MKFTLKSVVPFLFLNFISCSCMFAHWSWFETAFWDLRELLSFVELTEVLLCSFFQSPPLFLSPDLSPSFPVVKPVPTSSLFQFFWTSDTLIPGTHILFASLTCGHFLTAVNHNLKVLSTTAHRSLRVQQHIITESINKGINHWFLTCEEYAMAYKNISIFNSFLKVTQKQIIMVQVK